MEGEIDRYAESLVVQTREGHPDKHEMLIWMYDNCIDYDYFGHGLYVIHGIEDATLFKLMWG